MNLRCRYCPMTCAGPGGLASHERAHERAGEVLGARSPKLPRASDAWRALLAADQHAFRARAAFYDADRGAGATVGERALERRARDLECAEADAKVAREVFGDVLAGYALRLAA